MSSIISKSDVGSELYRAIDTAALIERIRTTVGSELLAVGTHGTNWHTFRMREELTFPDGTTGNPQIYLKNVNDGGTALRLYAGVFRLICTNGMMVAAPGATCERVIHIAGDTLNKFIDGFDTAVAASIDTAFEAIEEAHRLASIPVTERQAIEIVASLPLTEAARTQAFNRVTGMGLRAEDTTRNMWGLYNVVNEMNRRGSRSGNAAMDREVTLLTDMELLLGSVRVAA